MQKQPLLSYLRYFQLYLNYIISHILLQSSESFRKKQKLERELNNMKGIMEGLNQQGAKLSEVMATLRHSTPDLSSGQYKYSHGNKLLVFIVYPILYQIRDEISLWIRRNSADLS